jgi:hypothetical protein
MMTSVGEGDDAVWAVLLCKPGLVPLQITRAFLSWFSAPTRFRLSIIIYLLLLRPVSTDGCERADYYCAWRHNRNVTWHRRNPHRDGEISVANGDETATTAFLAVAYAASIQQHILMVSKHMLLTSNYATALSLCLLR